MWFWCCSTPLQVAPLDLDTDDFYEARKSLIETQLKRIHEGMAEEILISSWELHHGTSCRGVRWESHSLPDLRAAVSCIGGHCLASLCRHLALDYRNWSSGMPDLLLWRFHGDNTNKIGGGGGGGGEAKLVEVKGPRDRLSEQQRAWMLLLMDCGFDAEVCKVSPAPKDQWLSGLIIYCCMFRSLMLFFICKDYSCGLKQKWVGGIF